jgi:hypothetical protein
MQIKKEQLVQVTRCSATQTIKSTYCGFQSRSGPERYTKFHDPIVIEPADCRLAAKTGRFKLGRKDDPFEMNVRRSLMSTWDGMGWEGWTTTATARWFCLRSREYR